MGAKQSRIKSYFQKRKKDEKFNDGSLEGKD